MPVKLSSCMLSSPRSLFSLFVVLVLVLTRLFSFAPAQAQTSSDTPSPTPSLVEILAPRGGEAVLGSLPISVTTNVEGFIQAELYFGYSEDPTGTWFLLAQADVPLDAQALVQWDTTLISDGDYDLYLVVTRSDGSMLTDRVERMRVRNYSPVETSTPAPTETPAPGELPKPTVTLTPTVTPLPPTSTPLPPNPAEITPAQALVSLGSGAAIALGAFGLLGFYLVIRRVIQRR